MAISRAAWIQRITLVVSIVLALAVIGEWVLAYEGDVERFGALLGEEFAAIKELPQRFQNHAVGCAVSPSEPDCNSLFAHLLGPLGTFASLVILGGVLVSLTAAFKLARQELTARPRWWPVRMATGVLLLAFIGPIVYTLMLAYALDFLRVVVGVVFAAVASVLAVIVGIVVPTKLLSDVMTVSDGAGAAKKLFAKPEPSASSALTEPTASDGGKPAA